MPATWAAGRELRPLLASKNTAGRLALGTVGRRRVYAEAGHSVLVVGPTQSGKTSGLAIPAILEWEGPVVAASVKSDLARHTLGFRQSCGQVWVYDPSGSSGLPCDHWSPLAEASTWPEARRVARSLAEVARASAGALTDGDFWYATAAKLLAPLLLAASLSGRSMTDVVRWIDDQVVDEVAVILEGAGAWEAVQSARASWGRDDRQRSAVYTTAETVVEAFADPDVAASAETPAVGMPSIDPAGILDGRHTLYLCAPAHDQQRLRPLFATLVSVVIEAAYERAGRQGAPLDPPLLVVLDEAANVAPLAELDTLASTAAGHGVQLVTVFQDLAQVSARYGGRAGSVVNNHRAKVFLSGLADPGTLDHVSTLIGDAEIGVRATTVDGSGRVSTTHTPTYKRLAPADALRRLAPGKAVVISGHLPPVVVGLRPWQKDRVLRAKAQTPPVVVAPSAVVPPEPGR